MGPQPGTLPRPPSGALPQDGNTRLAWSATRVFCLLNGHDLTYTVDDAEDLMISAASGQLDVPDIAAWLQARIRPAS